MVHAPEPLQLLGGGLCRYERNSDTFTRFGRNHDLPHSRVAGILEDREGNLWLSTTSSGLFKFDPERNTVRSYRSTDGLQSDFFWRNSKIN